MCVQETLVTLIVQINLSTVPGRGRTAIQYAFGDWRRAPMIYEPTIEVPIDKLATGLCRNLSSVLSGTLRLQNLTFYNMNSFDYDKYDTGLEVQKHNTDDVKGERWYGYFGIQVDSFTGRAIFTGPKGQVNCDVVGLSQPFENGTWSRIWIRYDESFVTHPFKSLRLIRFDEFPSKEATTFKLYLEPGCSGLNQKQLELFTKASSNTRVLDVEFKKLIINFMRKFFILHVVEPHRMDLEGRLN